MSWCLGNCMCLFNREFISVFLHMYIYEDVGVYFYVFFDEYFVCRCT